MVVHDGGVPAEAGAPAAADEPLTALSEVPVLVTVRLGSARLTLRELLDLQAGSVLVLDRAVGDPAEVLVGDRVVALGELVRVERDLGLRITQVSPTGL